MTEKSKQQVFPVWIEVGDNFIRNPGLTERDVESLARTKAGRAALAAFLRVDRLLKVHPLIGG